MMNDANVQQEMKFCELLELATAGARGLPPKTKVKDWSEVLHLAHEHNVMSLLACALLHSSEDYCPQELRDYLLDALRSTSSVNALKRQRIFHLLHELENAQIDVILLKGYAVSRYYAHPESRDSVDTDILVPEEQEQVLYENFENRGFQVFERSFTSHHGICQSKKFGKIELHTHLYDEIVEDVWFSALDDDKFVMEPFERACVADGEYTTLAATDQLLFLTLHMIKHFIEGGLSIKMMLDTALHYAARRDCIDVDRYWSALKELHYADMVNAVLWMLIESGGFEEHLFPGIGVKVYEQINLLISDLVAGGYMGAKEQTERYESGMEYNRQLLLKNKNQFQYGLYMLWWKMRSGCRYMFPTVEMMKKRHKVIRKIPALYPLALVYQMISFPLSKVRSGALKRDIHHDKTGTNELSERRIEMFRKLGML